MTKITLQFFEINPQYVCTHKQFEYIRSLMSKTKHEDLWLNKLAFNGREKLTISEASKLIDCLINKKEFQLVEKHHAFQSTED